jgi:hypothetical protein
MEFSTCLFRARSFDFCAAENTMYYLVKRCSCVDNMCIYPSIFIRIYFESFFFNINTKFTGVEPKHCTIYFRRNVFNLQVLGAKLEDNMKLHHP